MPRFIFNDSRTKNSHGYRILTEGISLERFKKNPVMLDQHWENTWSVIGKWLNLKIENEQLSGEPEFDSEDENAARIEGKVDRGYLNAVSMGVLFSVNDLKYVDGELVLTRCELYEVSFVAIPSSSNTVRLYKEDGTLYSDEEVKTICLSLSNKDKNHLDISNMDKLKLSMVALVALGLTKENHSSEDVNAAILSLQKDKETADAEVEKLKGQLKKIEDDQEAERLKLATTLVENAIKEGRLTADKKEAFLAMAKSDFDNTKTVIEAIPTKNSFAKNTVTPTGGADEEMTEEQFQKLSLEEQKEFKENNPDAYNKIFNT